MWGAGGRDGRTDRPADGWGFTAKPGVLILFASLRVVISPCKWIPCGYHINLLDRWVCCLPDVVHVWVKGKVLFLSFFLSFLEFFGKGSFSLSSFLSLSFLTLLLFFFLPSVLLSFFFLSLLPSMFLRNPYFKLAFMHTFFKLIVGRHSLMIREYLKSL